MLDLSMFQQKAPGWDELPVSAHCLCWEHRGSAHMRLLTWRHLKLAGVNPREKEHHRKSGEL